MKKRIHEFLESTNVKFKFGVYRGEPHQAGKRMHSLEWSAAAEKDLLCLSSLLCRKMRKPSPSEVLKEKNPGWQLRKAKKTMC